MGLSRFSLEEKKDLFAFVSEQGIPVGLEGKSNWAELRERFYGSSSKYEPKSIMLIEKLICECRLQCQLLIQISDYSAKTAKEVSVPENPNLWSINLQQARMFLGITNLLKFVRKTILFNNRKLFNNSLEDYLEELREMPPGHPAYISEPDYNPAVSDP